MITLHDSCVQGTCIIIMWEADLLSNRKGHPSHKQSHMLKSMDMMPTTFGTPRAITNKGLPHFFHTKQYLFRYSNTSLHIDWVSHMTRA